MKIFQIFYFYTIFLFSVGILQSSEQILPFAFDTRFLEDYVDNYDTSINNQRQILEQEISEYTSKVSGDDVKLFQNRYDMNGYFSVEDPNIIKGFFLYDKEGESAKFVLCTRENLTGNVLEKYKVICMLLSKKRNFCD